MLISYIDLHRVFGKLSGTFTFIRFTVFLTSFTACTCHCARSKIDPLIQFIFARHGHDGVSPVWPRMTNTTNRRETDLGVRWTMTLPIKDPFNEANKIVSCVSLILTIHTSFPCTARMAFYFLQHTQHTYSGALSQLACVILLLLFCTLQWTG